MSVSTYFKETVPLKILDHKWPTGIMTVVPLKYMAARAPS